jgi:hypothetical protein
MAIDFSAHVRLVRLTPSVRLPVLASLVTLVSLTPLASFAARAGEYPAKRGDAFSKGPTLKIEDVVAKGEALSGTNVKLTGKVEQVCQEKGCWFALKSSKGESIRITSMGYKFFVPANASGRTATVEGRFEVKKLSVALAQHYENDRVAGTSEMPRKITKPVEEFTLAATAVELR